MRSCHPVQFELMFALAAVSVRRGPLRRLAVRQCENDRRVGLRCACCLVGITTS